jgi:hypothetical protein
VRISKNRARTCWHLQEHPRCAITRGRFWAQLTCGAQPEEAEEQLTHEELALIGEAVASLQSNGGLLQERVDMKELRQDREEYKEVSVLVVRNMRAKLTVTG